MDLLDSDLRQGAGLQEEVLQTMQEHEDVHSSQRQSRTRRLHPMRRQSVRSHQATLLLHHGAIGDWLSGLLRLHRPRYLDHLSRGQQVINRRL